MYSQVSVVKLLRRHVLAASLLSDLSNLRAQWLFALSATLQKPVSADTGSLFRGLLRHCCMLRATLANPQEDALPRLNTLIVIAGACFGQDEYLSGFAQND